VSTKIDKLLEFLASNDGPRPIEEIIETIGMSEDACREVIDFLAKYDFVHHEGERLAIDPKIRTLFDASQGKMCVSSRILLMVTPSPKRKKKAEG